MIALNARCEGIDVSYTLQGRLFSRILTNEPYKNLCVSILQLFDSGIMDLLLMKNETTNCPIECVRHRNQGVMPISSYGDGIKKVLSKAIISAVGNSCRLTGSPGESAAGSNFRRSL